MIGYKVLSKQGLKGPFRKSSILKAITSAMLPLQARLLDLQTGRYIVAAELVGEIIDAPRAGAAEQRAGETLQQMAEQPLQLAEDTPARLEETPRVILRGRIPLKGVKLPRPRKPAADERKQPA